MKTRVLRIDPSNPDKEKIRLAAGVIKRGGIVVFPTETVYGIGADAYNKRALKRIYKIKGRPSDNPSMIHVSSMRMASSIGIFTKRYYKTVERLWPGPLAFVVDARPGLNRTEVSIRMPGHKVALELIRASNTPIAAPSANISKRPSSTNAKHALKYFDGKVDLIIDSGPTRKGIESTILDLRSFQIQRPGAYPVERITKAFGRKPLVTNVAKGMTEARRAVAPGMKYRHYAPMTPLFLYTGNTASLGDAVSRIKANFVFVGSRESSRLIGKKRQTIALGSRNDLDEIARNLFDALIRLDQLGADFAVVESFPEKGIGLGIMNRLRKASGHRYFSTKRRLEALCKSINIR